MMYGTFASLLGLVLVWAVAAAADGPTPAASESGARSAAAKSFYDFTMTDIEGKDVPLARYKGRVCLVVNVASR